MNCCNQNVAVSFELWAFKPEDPNYITVLSPALRYFYYGNENVKLYIQGGLGVSLYGAVFFGDVGLVYRDLFIDIRSIVFLRVHPTYLTIGFKF